MDKRTLGQVARDTYEEIESGGIVGLEYLFKAVADAVIAAHEARQWQAWPDETGKGEYPPDETPVEVYCGKWASRDRLISQISVKRGTYGPSGASHWRFLPAPPQEVEHEA